MDEMSAKLLTVQEVADLLNVHPNTVRQWSDRELLKSYRIGPRGDRRFRSEDVNNFLSLKSKYHDKTVLIVDDEDAIRVLLQDIAKGKGCKVVAVGSGEKALEELRKQKFDLIFIDLMLSGLSGMEVMRHVKASNSSAVVTVISGYGDTSIDMEALNLGPMFFIHKPFEVSDIIDIFDVTMKLKS